MEEPFKLNDLNDFEVDEGLKAPSSGMSFETIEEAQKYYEDYGIQNGFWIRTRTSCKGSNRSNEVTSMLFVCAKVKKYVAKIENDGVVEETNETGEDGKGIPKKRAKSCSTVKYDKWSDDDDDTSYLDYGCVHGSKL
ncbi:hypothetical protein RHSIM_Rhsim01G0112800 [Rhododendron simsii]|uniref:FAR1 domain-containing protein n=1 Tax=Rhododendron simsii TaxID=118357 RepID=A0A834LYL6_RHOSS|nr:hypothetical protein RHSIM_Rhsim01G0112800 [Rhododendron simsii]